jgi:hypothetical protein
MPKKNDKFLAKCWKNEQKKTSNVKLLVFNVVSEPKDVDLLVRWFAKINSPPHQITDYSGYALMKFGGASA